jgi:hypothetical protein
LRGCWGRLGHFSNSRPIRSFFIILQPNLSEDDLL